MQIPVTKECLQFNSKNLPTTKMSINRKLSQKFRNTGNTEYYAVMKKAALLTSAELLKCCSGS